jgi:hypothetical protein
MMAADINRKWPDSLDEWREEADIVLVNKMNGKCRINKHG